MTRPALIVAHGQPSDPGLGTADMAALARQVAACRPGAQVAAATLADPDSLAAALAHLCGAASSAVVVPMFIADGWFTDSLLPRRLADLGAEGLPRLAPFGLWPETAALAARQVAGAAEAQGWDAAATTLLLAAHGSVSGPKPAAAVRQIAERIAAALPLARIVTGFLEEPPYLTHAARDLPPRSLCLPLFIQRWGHVRDDLPEALTAAGFSGPCLAPLGTDPAVARLIAARLG